MPAFKTAYVAHLVAGRKSYIICSDEEYGYLDRFTVPDLSFVFDEGGKTVSFSGIRHIYLKAKLPNSTTIVTTCMVIEVVPTIHGLRWWNGFLSAFRRFFSRGRPGVDGGSGTLTGTLNKPNQLDDRDEPSPTETADKQKFTLTGITLYG